MIFSNKCSASAFFVNHYETNFNLQHNMLSSRVKHCIISHQFETHLTQLWNLMLDYYHRKSCPVDAHQTTLTENAGYLTSWLSPNYKSKHSKKILKKFQGM